MTVWNQGQIQEQEEYVERQERSPHAYWDLHQLYRMSVRDLVDEFCGWQPLIELVNHPFNTKRNRAILAALFLTGGRITEVLSLKKEYFKAGMDSRGRPTVIVTGMLLEKHYKKIGDKFVGEDGKRHFKTERVNAVRKPFTIKLDEPMAGILWDWIENCKEEYLFATPYRHSKLPHLTRKWAYKFVVKLDSLLPSALKERLGLNKPFIVDGVKISDTLHLWCHWFRSQRASQLVENYDFRVEDLMSYFSWRDMKTALRYLHIGAHAQADKMDTDKLKGAR